MACTACHTAEEMHGMGAASGSAHRYDGAENPSCESCHAEQIGPQSGIPQHMVHKPGTMSCQVCHSLSYTNCTNCHVDRTADDVPFFSVEAHSLGFYVGRNPIQSEDRPYKYVPVRHVPVDINSFSAYGEDLLINFLSRPTWTYATPHNIQRITPQNETCGSCHGNEAIFLTADKVAEAERGGANLNVIVETIPPLFPGMPTPAPTQPPAPEEEMGEESGSSDADFWGSDGATESDEAGSSDADFWGSDGATESDEAGSSDADFWGSDGATESDEAGSSDADFWGSDGATGGE
jgi:hypothetical protein